MYLYILENAAPIHGEKLIAGNPTTQSVAIFLCFVASIFVVASTRFLEGLKHYTTPSSIAAVLYLFLGLISIQIGFNAIIVISLTIIATLEISVPVRIKKRSEQKSQKAVNTHNEE